MTGVEARPEAPEPHPGRKPLSKRRRQGYAIGLVVAIVVVIGVVVVAAMSPGNAPRAIPVPAADRNAPAALVQAANDLGYSPSTIAGAGTIEDAPAAAANAPLSSDLLPVGSKAPPFTLETPAGKKVSLSDFRGKAVLLEIFATWCPHCAAEAPHLRVLANELLKSKIAFVSIDGNGEDAASVFAYHRHFGLPFPALVDLDPSIPAATFPDHGHAGPVSKAYRTGYYPTFYVIDPQGRIAWGSDGEQPDALLRQQLERAAGV